MPAPTVQLSFTKVVFPPNPTAWVHTYTAGSFFAVAALTTEQTNEDLNALGREIFNQVETEFFTLEEKNLTTIKQVISLAIHSLPEHVTLSFAAAYVKETILYVIVAGAAHILLKRDSQLASLLQTPETTPNNEVHTASGLLQVNDILFLTTHTFSQQISTATLLSLHDSLPNELADSLTNRLQTVENSASASIIIKVEGMLQTHLEQTTQTPPQVSSAPAIDEDINPPTQSLVKEAREPLYPAIQEKQEEITEGEKKPMRKKLIPTDFIVPFKQKLKSLHLHIPIKTGIGLSIAIVVLLILGGSIFFIKNQQQHNQNQAIFQKYYSDAKSHYESAIAVSKVGTNPTGSQKDFQTAHDLLTQAKAKLSPNSLEEKQVQDLLQQVDDHMTQTTNQQTVSIQSASENDSPLLATEKKHTDTTYASADDTTIYYLTDKAIYQADKPSSIISNDNTWQIAGGFGAYLGNIYVLDKKAGISKFLTGNYTRTSYFAKDISPNLNKAVALTIDGSIYILFSDGNLTKYTKGQPDTFNLTGLDKPLSRPTRAFTNADSDNIYILDSGNSRIVKVNKTGAFQAQYYNPSLNTAKDIDVHEKDKKIYILTSNGIQRIDMQ